MILTRIDPVQAGIEHSTTRRMVAERAISTTIRNSVGCTCICR